MQEGRIYEYGTGEFKFTVNESIFLVDICVGNFCQKMGKIIFWMKGWRVTDFGVYPVFLEGRRNIGLFGQGGQAIMGMRKEKV